MESKKFYDVHMHTMDLSHANLVAFLERVLRDGIVKKIFKILLNCITGIFKKKPEKEPYVDKALNLLTFMESSIKYNYLVLEHYLKSKDRIVKDNNTFKIGSREYNKIVLCPLIMDFGNKSIKHVRNFYNMPPNKPVTDQISDVFMAIKTYYEYIAVQPGTAVDKFKFEKTSIPKNRRLFEIYPFMGMNTENYTIDKVEEMLGKVF